jgi:pSer/pThr/pTyr-binding forkhead associated (FHA) protein
MPELVLKLGDNLLQTYVFDKDVMSIGRSRDNDIVVENLSVSRNHARIRRQNGKYILTDLNSANGTYVNGVRVSKTEIVNDDVISVGKHRLHFADQPVEEEKMIADAFGADRTVIVDRVSAPVLCISDGKLKGQEFQITKFETSIGKAPSNDVVLGDDWFLAKKQAVIIRRGNHEYEIHDMGGFRRTKVNGVQLTEPKNLQSGDVIEFGNTRCVFQFTGDVPAPSGRVPQEMALEDSIFSSGVSYEGSEPAAHQEFETPFVADSDALPVSRSVPAEELFDPGSLAREAIAADEQARAEARQGANLYQQAAAGEANGSEGIDSLEELSLDNVGSLQSTFAEQQQPEELDEQPAPVYAGAGDEQHVASGSAQPDPFAVTAEMAYAAPAANVPLMPSNPGSSVGSETVSSPSGGRQSRKKRRERERQGATAQPAPGSREQQPSSPEPAHEAAAETPAASEPVAEASGERVSFEARENPSEDDQREVSSQGAPADQTEDPQSSLTPEGATPEEIALWEAALNNRSAVIRRQAAKMLKKLTGKDYEV